MKFKDMQKFEQDLDYRLSLLTTEDTFWCIKGEMMYWVDGDDDLYSGYLPEGYERKEDYLIANIDSQTGTWCTCVFPLEKELTLEEFEEKYEEVN